jgi:hypothetical protein
MKKIYSLAATRWPFSYRLVNVIEEHRILILEYFGSSEEQEGWRVNGKMAATGYNTFLKEK